MPLEAYARTGIVTHIAPPAHHAAPVPSRRLINASWQHLMRTLTKHQQVELVDSLATLRRVLQVE
jgi:hypothetical protein